MRRVIDPELTFGPEDSILRHHPRPIPPGLGWMIFQYSALRHEHGAMVRENDDNKSAKKRDGRRAGVGKTLSKYKTTHFFLSRHLALKLPLQQTKRHSVHRLNTMRDERYA